MTRTHHRFFPLKTKGKRFQAVTPQNITPGLFQELDLILTQEEEVDFIFPLSPEDIAKSADPLGVLEGES